MQAHHCNDYVCACQYPPAMFDVQVELRQVDPISSVVAKKLEDDY